ncbi:hypothetical protein B0H34DRAFT_795011 [Crassisporium funariophilum]|nr:hypothetical protein B0H34DRAFT_795011 [Crassisporium funariophilum]
MEDIAVASPASSSASDSDACNTESARVYFGPLKTPERNFVAVSSRLFPPAQSTNLRRSPRLSSPRPRSASPGDVHTAEDKEDIELVAQLINEDDEEDEETSRSGTPQRTDLLQDEPSSALADKVMHALDNPSPPPSPTIPLSYFDPYHTNTPDVLNSRQADFFTPVGDDGPLHDGDNPLLLSMQPFDSRSPRLHPPVSHTNVDPDMVVQEDLINFDSFSTPTLPTQAYNENVVVASASILPGAISVDDLLSQSPSIVKSPRGHQEFGVPSLIVEPPEAEPIPMESVSSPKQINLPKEIGDAGELVLRTLGQDQQGLSSNTSEASHAMLLPTMGEITTTPVRRSPRPRRSVSPNPPQVTPVVSLSPSIARTQIKKKPAIGNLDEDVVSDSQEERELGSNIVQQTPLRATPNTTNRVRQRSPGKSPMVFSRELGSLSPTSTDVLSKLGFTPAPEPGEPMNDDQPSNDAQPMFSFSMFPPPSDAIPPSTPARSGPIRFSTPMRAGTSSPTKLRLQTPALNDPANTPARRIPIEQAIFEGQVSPQKAVQLGFNPNGTPLPSVSTPARRVLISEKPKVPVSKTNGLRFGSPAKPKERERSVEPNLRMAASVKGKGREMAPEQLITGRYIAPSTKLDKLPYPLVPSEPPATSRSAQTQESLTPAQSSPLKSNLKQATSRIPRIGTKPYARPPVLKHEGAKDRGTATMRMVDLSKRTPNNATDSAPLVRRAISGQELGKSTTMTTTSSSRVKPTFAASASMLKRKREQEKNSPAKPRVIMLRQVPQVIVTSPPVSQAVPTAIADRKKPAQAQLRIRRVVDPEPSIVVSKVHTAQNPAGSTILHNPRYTSAEPAEIDELSPLSPLSDSLQLGSPMKQDQHVALDSSSREEQTSIESATVAVALPDDLSTLDASSLSNPRRTTRSRRTTKQDSFSEGSSRPLTSRRKPASSRSDDIFSGMSMTALKDLTISNTVRNQQYLSARLETEVIRKEGARPESPAVKIRTIVQRQTEEKLKQRSERAQRRARRSGDDMASSDIEGSSDVGYSSPCEGQSKVGLVKHQRGPGDEDDYETPERPDRHMKRIRLFEDGDAIQGVEQPQRRVKWDRGLFTAVYLDEVELGSRQPSKENRSLKGILAPTAKALRLDTLGNLTQAELPLTELVQENVTVKKFVYDSDVVPVPELIVVKNTRSKGRKGRS